MHNYDYRTASGGTLSKRIEAVYTQFAIDTYAEIRKLLPDLRTTLNADPRVSIGWDASGRGFRFMTVEMLDHEGKKLRFKFLPEEPASAAGEILFKHGGY